RLYLETQRRRQLVNHVYAYAYTPRDPGLFIVEAGLAHERLPAALDSLLSETYATRHASVSHGELEKVKTILLSDAAYQHETVQGLARKLGFYEVVAGDFAFEQAYEQQLRALTAADLVSVAQRYFTALPTIVAQVPQDGPAVSEQMLSGLIESAFARASAPKVRTRGRGALDVVRAELANGAVLLARRDESPVLAMRAVALGGLRWEDRARQGLGNLFASLFGRATAELSVEALAARSASLGGSLSAFSGRNSVGMRGEFVGEHGDAGLHLFFDTLVGSQISAEDLERERAIVLEQIKNREDNPPVIAFDLFAEALFPSHPYGLKLLGSADTVRAVTLDEVTAYGRMFLSPERLVLSVVGDVDPERVVSLAALRLGESGSARLPDPPARDSPPTGPRRVSKALDKKQAHLIIGGMGTTVDHSDRHALEVLTTILSGQSGRLFLDLRDRRGLAYALSSSSVEGLDPGYVLVHVGTGPEQIEAARQGVYDHLARIRDEPVSSDELSRAHRYLVGTHAIDLQRAGSRAMVMALGELFGLGYDQYARYASEIREVTRERVQAAARKYLAPERLVEAMVGPAA
ncbi:MAG: insulinase family protein, partial [Deltaproteobacteria bacterium]|nr:insulinase family protein [Deltaproteobacteria bacterium]